MDINIFFFLCLTGCCPISRLPPIWSCGCHRNADWQVGDPITKQHWRNVYMIWSAKKENRHWHNLLKQILKARLLSCHWSCRWLVLDTDSKDLVTVHTDGNEQLSVMCYGPGMVITADRVFPLCIQSVFTVCCYLLQHSVCSRQGKIIRRQNFKDVHFVLFYRQ